MSSQLLWSLVQVLSNNDFPKTTTSHNQQRIPFWLKNHSLKPRSHDTKNIVWEMIECDQKNITILQRSCGHSCTEIISSSPSENSSTTLFLLFGGSHEEIVNGVIKYNVLNDLYLLELTENEFTTCCKYILMKNDGNEYNNNYYHVQQQQQYANITPKGRQFHSSCYDAHRHLLFVFGGKSGMECLNDLAVFDVKTSQWIACINYETWANDTITVVPQARYGHACVLFGDWLIIHGGKNENGMLLNDLYALDLNSGIWINLEPYLIVTQTCSSTFTSEETTSSLLSGRCFFTMNVIRETCNEIDLWIAGGLRSSSFRVIHNPTDLLDSTFCKLTIIRNHKAEGSSQCVVLVNDVNSTSMDIGMEKRWDKFGHCSVFREDKLLLVGGMDSTTMPFNVQPNLVQDSWIFDNTCIELDMNSGDIQYYQYSSVPTVDCVFLSLHVSSSKSIHSNVMTNPFAFHDGFSFATLLHDSTLTCYIVGGFQSFTHHQDDTIDEQQTNQPLRICTHILKSFKKVLYMLRLRFYLEIIFEYWFPELRHVTFNFKQNFLQELSKRAKTDNSQYSSTWPQIMKNNKENTTKLLTMTDVMHVHSSCTLPKTISFFCEWKALHVGIIAAFNVRTKEFISRLVYGSKGHLLEGYHYFFIENVMYAIDFTDRSHDNECDIYLICFDLTNIGTWKSISSPFDLKCTKPQILIGLEEDKHSLVYLSKKGSKTKARRLDGVCSDEAQLAAKNQPHIYSYLEVSTNCGYGFHQLLEFVVKVESHVKTNTKKEMI
ncbi:hypothetical protein C9374_001329 [Naegleria lovaniensis]|uniref:Uncharacterized protein n=1 Tax=Naegleria lovaniensis TaxID=51637 RepID=A0AA88GVL3_NAELO|nr:uncharacterized protein C9374_001329 [Naegleria lovaniensis]KAG2387735.1 hypothetical protein C9374_001329 [Naegleria lovaniensis]